MPVSVARLDPLAVDRTGVTLGVPGELPWAAERRRSGLDPYDLIWVMPAKGAVALSELELIERIASQVRTRPGVVVGIGDDAAVLEGDPAMVATQDLLVEDVHFRRSTAGFADLGHKALAVSLSDLAAMGAKAVAALVGLGLPAGDALDDADIGQLYSGMEALAARFGVSVAGGDLTAAPALVLSVTALGRLPTGCAAVRRDGARPGDVLCTTGVIGGAGVGLSALDDPAAIDGVPESMVDAAILRHRRPEPRLTEGELLRDGGATAMMDISDGLGIDALRLARASGVTIEIDLGALPLHPSVEPITASLGRDPALAALAGGEDYELLVCLPKEEVSVLATGLTAGLTAIGGVVEGRPDVRLTRGGDAVRTAELGYLHDV